MSLGTSYGTRGSIKWAAPCLGWVSTLKGLWRKWAGCKCGILFQVGVYFGGEETPPTMVTWISILAVLVFSAETILHSLSSLLCN